MSLSPWWMTRSWCGLPAVAPRPSIAAVLADRDVEDLRHPARRGSPARRRKLPLGQAKGREWLVRQLEYGGSAAHVKPMHRCVATTGPRPTPGRVPRPPPRASCSTALARRSRRLRPLLLGGRPDRGAVDIASVSPRPRGGPRTLFADAAAAFSGEDMLRFLGRPHRSDWAHSRPAAPVRSNTRQNLSHGQTAQMTLRPASTRERRRPAIRSR